MPFEVEPTATMRPPVVIATAVAPWKRRPKPVSAVPAFANPASSVPFGRYRWTTNRSDAAARRSPTTTMPPSSWIARSNA